MTVVVGLDRGRWPEAAELARGSVVTMGVFDGFHRGHQALLDRAAVIGRRDGRPVVLVTFDPHPLTVLAPERAPVPLLPVDDRVAHAGAHGADHVLVLRFTPAFAALDPGAFVRTVLRDRLACRDLVVGANFRCGHRGAGDVARLRAEGLEHGFDVHALDLVGSTRGSCSSTAVRRALADGDTATARDLLGRHDARILRLAVS